MSNSQLKAIISSYVESGNQDWYVNEKRLGGGGGGQVYLARIKKNNKEFALKIIGDSENEMGTLTRSADWERENKIMKSLDDHPNIICIYSEEVVDKEYRIYMELAMNGSLRSQYLALKKGFNDITTAKYTSDILKGLEYLHGKRIIHHDVKCDNVLLGSDGNAKLTDFGIANSLILGKEYFTKCGFTLCFCAPEVMYEDKHGFEADIWSLGATVVEMKLGDYPHDICTDGDTLRKYRGHKFSNDAMTFMEQCLKIDPKQRAQIPHLQRHSFLK